MIPYLLTMSTKGWKYICLIFCLFFKIVSAQGMCIAYIMNK